jgi:opacity protein-like surface antigen
MELSRLVLCALLLAPLATAAQEAPAVEGTPQESPAEEAPADEGTGVEGEAAQEPAGSSAALSGFVDLYAVPATALTRKGAPDPAQRGDGVGARAMLNVLDHLAVTAEYATRTFDDVADDLIETSFGVGATVQTEAGDQAGLFVEYDKLDFEVTELDGYSVHGRLARRPNGWFNFYGDIGYLFLQDEVEDQEGIEFTIGLGFGWRMLGLFADWHFADLEGQDSGARSQLADVRAGARLRF